MLHHLLGYFALFLFAMALVNLVYTIISGKEWPFLLFLVGILGGFMTLIAVGATRPVVHCTTTADSVVQWRQHHVGKGADWWVYATLPDPDTFCELHGEALYNMGIGYKLNHIYTGELVERP